MIELTIIRGMPGSGKSFFARQLSGVTGAIHLEPDMFCVEGGRYVYSLSRTREAWKGIDSLLKFLKGKKIDIIFSDVLPELSDIMKVIEPFGTEMACRLFEMPSLSYEESKARNVHRVRGIDLEQMLRTFVDLDVCISGIKRAGYDFYKPVKFTNFEESRAYIQLLMKGKRGVKSSIFGGSQQSEDRLKN